MRIELNVIKKLTNIWILTFKRGIRVKKKKIANNIQINFFISTIIIKYNLFIRRENIPFQLCVIKLFACKTFSPEHKSFHPRVGSPALFHRKNKNAKLDNKDR